MTEHHITPRRRDRAKTDESWIVDCLSTTPVITIATVVHDQPYSNINTFVYDAETHAIYCHTAGRGRLRDEIEANPKVCLSTYRMGRLLPADTAREFSVEYDSVVIFGNATIVNDRSLARLQMQRLLDKYFGHLQPGRDYRPITDQEMAEITVLRIDIEAWSGKGKFEPADFPGAFEFGHPPDPPAVG